MDTPLQGMPQPLGCPVYSTGLSLCPGEPEPLRSQPTNKHTHTGPDLAWLPVVGRESSPHNQTFSPKSLPTMAGSCGRDTLVHPQLRIHTTCNSHCDPSLCSISLLHVPLSSGVVPKEKRSHKREREWGNYANNKSRGENSENKRKRERRKKLEERKLMRSWKKCQILTPLRS